jgi:hypothetical protein
MKKWIPFFILCVFCPVLSSAGIEEAKKTMKDMFWLQNRADMYLIIHNRYPAVGNIKEFAKEVESITRELRNREIPMKDAWGNEFQYRSDSEHKNVWISSYGSDGKPDSGIYDSSGIPDKEEYPPTSDPKNDIILKNGKFILRNLQAEEAAYEELKMEYQNRNSQPK